MFEEQWKRHRTTSIQSERTPSQAEITCWILTRCFFPDSGDRPKDPKLTNRMTRPLSSSHTVGSRSQNRGTSSGLPPPSATKWYRGFVLRTTSATGSAPDGEGKDGAGRGAEEKAVMFAGKVFVRRMSIYCDEAVDALIAANEPYEVSFELVVGADLVIVFARSFSTVKLVKYGDVNPWSLASVTHAELK